MADMTFETLAKLKQEIHFDVKNTDSLTKAIKDFEKYSKKIDDIKKKLESRVLSSDFKKQIDAYDGDIKLWAKRLEETLPNVFEKIAVNTSGSIDEFYKTLDEKDVTKFSRQLSAEGLTKGMFAGFDTSVDKALADIDKFQRKVDTYQSKIQRSKEYRTLTGEQPSYPTNENQQTLKVEADEEQAIKKSDELLSKLQEIKDFYKTNKMQFALTGESSNFRDVIKQYEKIQELRNDLKDGEKSITEEQKSYLEDIEAKINHLEERMDIVNERKPMSTSEKNVIKANSIGNLDFNSLITNGEAWGLPQLSDPMIAVIQAIQKLATQAVDVFKHMVDKSFELKKKYVDVFSSLAQEIGGPIGDIVSEFAPIVKSMLDIGQSINDLGFDQISSLIQGKAGLFSFIEGIVDIKHNIKELQLDIYQTFAKIGIKAIKTFAGAISKLSGFDGLKNLFKSIQGQFSNIVRRVGYQAIRRVISQVFKDIQTQIQSLAKTSSAFNTQISNILQKLYQLGASIVGLFAPILSAIYPVVIKIIDYCNAIVEAVGKVISALTGKSYFKAIVSGYDYAAEAASNAADEQERFLADWDTLNKLPDPNKSSSDSSSGNSLSDLVTWEEVLPSENEWATAIKNMFNGEGESLGSLISAEINKAVDTLDKFWEDNDVKTKLNKFATGLATTINTAIQNTDWSQLGTSIGTKLGDVVDSITNFWQTIDTEEVAQAIADFFNSLNETNLINKLATMIYTIGKVILDVIVKAIEKIDWEEAGKKLAEALNKIASLADDIDWTKVVEAIKTLGTSLMQELETGPLGAFFEQIGYVIENFIELMQDIAEGDLIGAAWNATQLGAAVSDLKDMSEEYCNLMSTFPDITSAEAGALSDLNQKYIATQGSLKGTKAWAKKWIDQNPEMVKSLLDDKEALKEYLKEMGFSETEAKRITKTISGCWEEYGGVVETETDGIIEDIEGVSTETATKSKAAADSFDKNFVQSSIWSDTDTKLSDVATSMAATMSSDNIFTLALDWLTSLISGLGNKQKNDEIKTKGTNISTGLLSSIKTALGWNSSSGIFTNIYNVGVNILKGLSSGLDNKTENNNISAKATKIGAKAVGGVSKGAQEGSPSKATRRTGKYILQGLIIGLQDSALNKQLESTSYDVGADSINTLNEGLNKELGLGVDKLSSKGIQISYAGGNDALISSIYSIAENTSNINRIIEKCVADATVLPAVSVAQLTTAIHNQTQMEQSYYEAILSAISYSSSNIQQAINKSNQITQQSALQIDGMAIVNAINKISSQQSKSPLIIV